VLIDTRPKFHVVIKEHPSLRLLQMLRRLLQYRVRPKFLGDGVPLALYSTQFTSTQVTHETNCTRYTTAQ
jgi:hypothetical protein